MSVKIADIPKETWDSLREDYKDELLCMECVDEDELDNMICASKKENKTSDALIFYELECINQAIYQDNTVDEPIVFQSDGPHSFGYFKSEDETIAEMNGLILFSYSNEYEGRTNRDDYRIIFLITKHEIT